MSSEVLGNGKGFLFNQRQKMISQNQQVYLSVSNYLGKPSIKKSAVFLNIVQNAFDPPPFCLNICPILRGVFLYVVCMLYVCMGVFVCCMYVVCCINVGVREAPCKKSFGILASYWTPPKIK